MRSFLSTFCTLLFLSACSSNSTDQSSSSAVQSGISQDDVTAVEDVKAVVKQMTNSNDWQVTLTWTDKAPAGLRYLYTIKRTTRSGNYEACEGSDSTCDTEKYTNVTSPYVISKLKAGTKQYFKISITVDGNQDISAVESSEYAVKIPLDAYTVKPGAFSASGLAGDGQVTISWSEADKASFYIIQKGTSSGSYPVVVKNLASSPYIDSKLTNGKTLYYMVIAVNSVGSTNASAEIVATPMAAPGAFSDLAASGGVGSVSLNWGASEGASSYLVKRAASASGPFTQIAEITTTSYTDSSVSNGTSYFYQVSAVNGGTSTDSNVASATPLALPAALTAIALGGSDSVTLSWGASAGASSYTIQYGTTSGSYPLTFSTNATSPTVVTGLSIGTTYYFRLIAVNANGGSTNADEVSASPISPWPVQLGIPMDEQMNTFSLQANAITSDSTGLYVTGGTDGLLYGSAMGGYHDIFLVKYNYSGTLAWTRQLSGPDYNGGTDSYSEGRAIASDGLGNVYIVGSTEAYLPPTEGGTPSITFPGNYTQFMFVAKYNSSGTLVWTKQVADNYYDGVTADGVAYCAGNLYVTGNVSAQLSFAGQTTTPNWDGQDFYVSKFNASTGDIVWTSVLPSGNFHNILGRGISCDSSGNSYIGGTTNVAFDSNSLTGYPDAFVAKYDTDGNRIWSTFLGAASAWSNVYKTVIDGSGNLYTTGTSTGSLKNGFVGGGIFVSKFNPSTGAMVWIDQFSGSGEVNGIGTDSSGAIYISGVTGQDINGQTLIGSRDAYICKYDASGTQLMTTLFGAVDASLRTGDIAIDSTDNVFLSGYTDSALGNNTQTGNVDLFVNKYNSSGVQQ